VEEKVPGKPRNWYRPEVAVADIAPDRPVPAEIVPDLPVAADTAPDLPAADILHRPLELAADHFRHLVNS